MVPPPPPPPPPAKDDVPMPPPPPPPADSSGNDAPPPAPEETQVKSKAKPKKKKAAKEKSGKKGALVGVLLFILIGAGAGFAIMQGYIPLDMFTGGGDPEIVDVDPDEPPDSTPDQPDTSTNETDVVSTPEGPDASTNETQTVEVATAETNTASVAADPVPTPASDIQMTLLHRLNNGNDVNALDISADGTRIVSFASRDKANLWDANTGTRLETISNPGLHTLSFDNSGKHIIFHGTVLNVYRISDKKVIQNHDWLAKDTGGSLNAIDVSNDGRTLALGAANSKTILLWSLVENQVVREIQLPVGNSVTDLCFSHDGTQLAVAGKSYVYLFDISTGQALFRKNASVPDQIALSPDGKHAVHLISSETIAVIDTSTGDQLRVIKDTGKSTLTELIFSADGKYVLGSSWDGHIYVWDFESGDQLAKTQAHEEWVTSMALSENGKTLVTGSDDDTIGVWNIQGLVALTVDSPELAERVEETPPEQPPITEPTPPVETNVVQATPAVPVDWPSLKINGLMGQGEKGAVIINDEIIRIGYTYDDVKVIEIKGKTVVLEYKNETRKLMVGSSTN